MNDFLPLSSLPDDWENLPSSSVSMNMECKLKKVETTMMFLEHGLHLRDVRIGQLKDRIKFVESRFPTSLESLPASSDPGPRPFSEVIDPLFPSPAIPPKPAGPKSPDRRGKLQTKYGLVLVYILGLQKT